MFKRDDYSASILRVATSAEISENIFVRNFLSTDHKLPAKYVISLLFSSNGLDEKFKRLICPAVEYQENWKEIKTIQKQIELLNGHRNAIAHSGYFKSKEDAKSDFNNSLNIIQTLSPNEANKLKLPF